MVLLYARMDIYANMWYLNEDAAKSLYKNATIEKLALLRTLRDREVFMIQLEQTFGNSLEVLNGNPFRDDDAHPLI